MSTVPSIEVLRAIASEAGIDELGVCSAEPFTEVLVELHRRTDAGLRAGMQFTYRNPERSTDPQRALPGARAIVVGALAYRRARPETAHAHARIAEYVWEPYYDELRSGLGRIAARLEADGYRARVLVDDNLQVDRAAAHRAGIGWWGKNANLLVPDKGSRFALGSVVTDAPLPTGSEPLADQCGPCRRCIDNCPTDAIVDDGVIDARRCLAWLVQATGVFPHEHRRALGDRIYGCDDCQTTCPPNTRHDRQDPPEQTSGVTSVAVVEMLRLSDEELLDRFGAWYIPRREPRYLRRNALIVLGNTADGRDPEVRDLIEHYLDSDDEIERAHAVWAAGALGLGVLAHRLAEDEAEIVRTETALLDV